MTLVYTDVKAEDITFLSGFSQLTTTSKYETMRLSDGNCLLILYTTGKLVVRAKDEWKAQQILDHLTSPYDKKAHIGSDETLKGDTFGGLIVCAFAHDPLLTEALRDIGVRDSKSLTEASIHKVADTLKEHYSDRFAIIELSPQEYNEHNSVTSLLNKLHEKVASELKTRFGKISHIVDAYPGCRAGDEQITKAESISLAVAAASIIARQRALEQMDGLTEKAGFVIPRGSTHVQAALEELIEDGRDLRLFCKLHFSNVQKTLSKARQTKQ